MVDLVKDYAWRNHTSVSAIVRDILLDVVKNPRSFRAQEDIYESFGATLTVYVTDDLWFPARDAAYNQGRIPLSVLIRKGLLARMKAAEDIPA